MKKITIWAFLILAIGLTNCKEVEKYQNRQVDRQMESIDQRIFNKNVKEYQFLMKHGKALDQEIAASQVRLSCIALKLPACIKLWTKLEAEARARR